MSSDNSPNREWINDLLSNPAIWLITTIIVVIIAYVLIPEPQVNRPDEVVRKIVSNEFTTKVQSLEEKPAQTAVKEDNMLITRDDDKERFNDFLEVEAIDKKIQPLFVSAREHVDNDRLVGTDGDNAWQKYQAILDLDPENTEARSGIATILDFLIENTEMAIESQRYQEAEPWISMLDIAQPGDALQEEFRQEIADALAKIEEEKRRKQEEAERQQKISALIEQAHEESKPFTFDFDKVREIYLEVLSIDPDSIESKNGLISLSNRQLDNAEILIRANMLERARKLIESAQLNYPKNSRLSGLELALDVQQKQYEQEKRIAQEQLEQEAIAKRAQEEAKNREEIKKTAEEDAQKNDQPTLSATNASTDSETQTETVAQADPKPVASTSQSKANNPQQLLEGVSAYYEGKYARAFEILFPIAENGEPRAQFRLGMMYLEGRSVTKNQNIAADWFTKSLPGVLGAAQGGAAWAQADLGTAYELGISLKQDYERAAYWYQLAATSGYAGAQTNLGVMYANGDGVPADVQKAIFWLNKAAAQGDTIAAENLKILSPRLNKTTTKETDARSSTDFRAGEVDK